jgi:hypothetical protein
MSLITIKEFHLHVHAELGNAIRLLNEINERTKTMPTVAELKTAVADAVGQEAAEVAARLKALEDEVVALKEQIANGTAISQADIDDVLTSIRGIFTPA